MREFKASTMPECKERARKRALQKACVARKTYALDTAWWRENSRVKLAKTTSYIQYRLIQQSRFSHQGLELKTLSTSPYSTASSAVM